MSDVLIPAIQKNPPRICLIFDEVRTSTPSAFGIFSGFQWYSLSGKLERAGIRVDSCSFILLGEEIPSDTSVIVGFGERVLRTLTDKKGIDKWQLSPLTAYDGKKFIPTFDLGRVLSQYELNLYQELALQRAAEESQSTEYSLRPEERFRLNPSVEETFAVLEHIEKSQPEISVDIETGYGQINTVGFAWSASDAIAINVLPSRCSDETYLELWRRIARVLSSDSRKIFQNLTYDVTYLSAYGIRTENINHDTMWAMKFLWPELDMNLGNVGRIYTRRPYWKDDGKVEHEEGKKKNWGNIRDWNKHYLYNCRDTTGTWEAKQRQFEDIFRRGLLPVWNDYIRRLFTPVLEMCWNGMPLSHEKRELLRIEVNQKVEELTAKFQSEVGYELNPNSPKQVMKFLKDSGVVLPKKYNKAKGSAQETTDASAIKKIRLKHPELTALGTLADIKTLSKALSSYINFHTKPGDDRVRYSLIGTGTETLRMSGGKDPWGCGFNIQTIPREGGDVSIKSMFEAPEGYSFIEVDLRQAESRFVAYDSADKTLIDMLESGEDVHSYVADEIIKKLGKDISQVSKEEYKKTWRQLGKKSGHGFNYNMKEKTFIETVFSEMDLVLEKKEATIIREAYYGLFPGIPRWHEWIRTELKTHRKLTAPSGWERYFYGRYDDDMFKEAYAWRPQHTIPWITNRLMIYLTDERELGNANFHLLLQCHDALYMLAPDERLNDTMRICLDAKLWHPQVDLPGGRMVIPTEVKYGKILSDLTEWEG